MRPAASTESLRTRQRRSERTRHDSQRERLALYDPTDCWRRAYDDFAHRAKAIFLGRNVNQGEDSLKPAGNTEVQLDCEKSSEFDGRWKAFRDPPSGNLHRARSRSTLVWPQFHVISNHRTAIERIMKGMILAYGLYIATSLVSLAVGSYAYGFDAAWNIIRPFSYPVSVLIWLTALCPCRPNPVPILAIWREADHEDSVSRTQIRMGKAARL
jgi:hypothetical protein